MIKIFLPALLLIGLSSCQENDGGGQGTAVPASSSSANAPSETMAPPPNPTTQPSSTNNTQGVALNPPHGEPGHVCEIPVGQPLDGSGQGGPASTPQEIMIDPSQMNGGTTTITPSMTTPGTGPTPPGMNPPHGEPGHVCEIPVGEPLP